jgi:hypothetical protein
LSDVNYRVLDLERAPIIRAYEELLYAAFSRVPTNRLVRSLWDFDDAARRVRVKVPYSDQVIYGIEREDGRLLTAMAVNVRLALFQAAFFGFPRPDSKRRCAEILTFAGVDSILAQPTRRRQFFLGLAWADLRRRGFDEVLATSAAGPAGIYQRLGLKKLAETEMAGERRVLLGYRWRGEDQRRILLGYTWHQGSCSRDRVS